MYTPTTVYLDNVDLASVGFLLGLPGDALAGARDFPGQKWGVLALPPRQGVSFSDGRPVVSEKRFALIGTLIADTAAALRAQYLELLYRADGGDHLIRLVDDSSREIVARLDGQAKFTPLGYRVGALHARVELPWLAADPYWRATTDTTVALSGVGATCQLGTAESWAVITLDGAVAPIVDPVLHYTDNAGTDLETLALTVTINNGEQLVIDMDARTITDAAGNVDATLRASGNYFALSPRDGSWLTSTWPKLRLTASSGAPTGDAVYRIRDLA